MTLLVLYILIVTTVSFICSATEAVILSVTHAHIEILKKKRSKTAAMLNDLKVNIDQTLAAILTMNTISNTAGSTLIGAQVLKLYGDSGLAYFSVIFTVIILVFSEILPKTLGASYWKNLAPFAAYASRLLIIITYPFVIMTKGVSKIAGAKNEHATRITREEMLANAEIGETEGILHKKETLIIRNLLRLNSIYVKDIMTPRSVLVSFSKDDTIQKVMDEYKSVPFSRIPIFEKDIDHVVGMIFRFEFLERWGGDFLDMRLEEFSHPVHTIHQNQSVAVTIDEFIKRREHMFIAIDDYGTTMGLVTLEDAIETLLGVEIMDETDDIADMRKFAQDRWEKRQLEIQRLTKKP